MSSRSRKRSSKPFTGSWTCLTTVSAVAAAFAISACGGGAAGVDANDNGEGDEGNVSLDLYAPQNLPSTFTVEVPDSLDSESDAEGTGRIARRAARGGFRVGLGMPGTLTDMDGDCEDDATGTPEPDCEPVTGVPEATEYTAIGYESVLGLVNLMRWKQGEVALQFLMADAIFDDLVEACGNQDTDAGCSIGSGELSLTYTEEMVNFILNAEGIGPDHPDYETAYAGLSYLIDEPQSVPMVLYKTLDGLDGYDHEILFYGESHGDTTSATTLRWSADQTRVEAAYSYDSPIEGGGSSIFSYDDSDQRLTYRYSTYGIGVVDETYTVTSSDSYRFTLEKDPSREDTNGVIFTSNSEYLSGASANSVDFLGIADDEGGYVQTRRAITGDSGTTLEKYSEGFDGDGTLLFSAYADCTAGSSCDAFTYEGESDGLYGATFAASFDYLVDFEEKADAGPINEAVAYELTGSTSGIDHGATIVFTRAGTGEPEPDQSNVIGFAYYDPFTPGWVTYVWGSPDEAASAEAYREDAALGTAVTYTTASGLGLE